jgi:hypothetical protein
MKFARGVTTQTHMEGRVNGPLSGIEWIKSRRMSILCATVLFSFTRGQMKWEQAPTLFFVKEGKMELFSPFLPARGRLNFFTHSHGSWKISSLQSGYRIHPSPHSTHFNPEGWDSRFIQNVGICLQRYVMSQPQSEQSPQQKPENLLNIIQMCKCTQISFQPRSRLQKLVAWTEHFKWEIYLFLPTNSQVKHLHIIVPVKLRKI